MICKQKLIFLKEIQFVKIKGDYLLRGQGQNNKSINLKEQNTKILY
jgi:hypothetical protein